MPSKKKKGPKASVNVPDCGAAKSDGTPCRQKCMKLPSGKYTTRCFQHGDKPKKFDDVVGEVADHLASMPISTIEDCAKVQAYLLQQTACGALPIKLMEVLNKQMTTLSALLSKAKDLDPKTQAALAFSKERACIAAQKMDPALADSILAKADAFLLEMSQIKPATIEIKPIVRESEENDSIDNEES